MEIEYEGDGIVVHDISDDLPRGPGAYLPRKGLVEEVIFHQTAGGTTSGVAGPQATARFHTAAPVWATNPDGSFRLGRKGKRILVGGGRGWPGIAYHLFIPWHLERDPKGKVIVYRTTPDGTVSYHTGGGANRHGIGVVFQGYFETRHTPQPEIQEGPSELHLSVASELLYYLCSKYGLRVADAIRGHFDYGKPACPGDVAEEWIRSCRDEEVVIMSPRSAWLGRLSTWELRERALWLTGYLPETPDGKYDYKTRGAIERFQRVASLVVDGIWGPQTERAMMKALRDINRDTDTLFIDQAAQPTLWVP